MGTDSGSVRQALSSLDYPASKDQIVAHAQHHAADDATVAALRAMPVADYAGIQEVLRSVTLDTGSEEGRTHGDKAKQASQSGKDALAEHQTQAPVNPIVDEIGENPHK